MTPLQALTGTHGITPIDQIHPWEWQMLPTTRTEAKKEGLTRYYTGKPCLRKHLSYRDVSSQRCALCAAEDRRDMPDEARERQREHFRAWRNRNLEAQRARERNYHARDRETSRRRARQYQINNPEKVCAAVKARAEYAKRATPPWADMDAIRAFYLACPKGMDVDHIVPLRGKNICGLHVLGNLQYLDHIENIKKGNRWDG